MKRELRSQRGVDFVGEDVFCECEADGVVEPQEKLGQGLVVTTDEHSKAVVSIGGGGDASNRLDDTEGDRTVVEEACDVG